MMGASGRVGRGSKGWALWADGTVSSRLALGSKTWGFSEKQRGLVARASLEAAVQRVGGPSTWPGEGGAKYKFLLLRHAVN